jgi:hypothetical protein
VSTLVGPVVRVAVVTAAYKPKEKALTTRRWQDELGSYVKVLPETVRGIKTENAPLWKLNLEI